MRLPVAVIDTNVVVSGLITGHLESPPCLVLDGMLGGHFSFLLSIELLSEYRRVLLRSKIKELHGLSEDEVDMIITEIAANGILRETEPAVDLGPDRGDTHLWNLLKVQPEAVLVTGDKALLDNPPDFASVISPRGFLSLLRL